MAATAKITLGETEHTVRRLTIGELEEVIDVFQTVAPHLIAMRVLAIGLRRADPPVPNVKVVEATLDQVRDGSNAILELAGLNQKDPNPPQPPPGA